jgi:hypothetical protein
MLSLPLRPHPDFPSGAVTQIGVKVVRPSVDRLVLSYIVTGEISDVRMPPVAAAKRGDELWRHTCFEMFVRESAGLGYYEFNFAPSTQWAAYRFDGYRSGMSVVAEIDAASIETQSSPDRFTLQTTVPIERLSALPVASGLVGGDRGQSGAHVVLGSGASVRKARLSSHGLLCP